MVQQYKRINEHKRLNLKDKEHYLFGIIGVNAIFISTAQNIYAEIVAEFMKYSLGKKISGSFVDYITIFHFYYYLGC